MIPSPRAPMTGSISAIAFSETTAPNREATRAGVTPRLRGSAAGPGGLPVPSSRFRGGLSTGEVTLLGALGNDGFQGIGAKLFASGSATEPLRVNRPTSVESRLVGP